MPEPHMPELPLLDRVKIQAEVLVPLFHAIEDEIGRERAREVVGGALRQLFEDRARERWESTGQDLDVFLREWAKGSGTRTALTTEVKRQDATHFDFDVKGCKYAEFWRGIGEPDLGFLLQCSADFAVDGAVDPIHLERSQTRMQGASHCDFRFTFDRAEAADWTAP